MAAELPKEFAALRKASRALAKARSLREILAIRDQAEAVRPRARSSGLAAELQNLAVELKLRAERKAGRLLHNLKLRGGDRRSRSCTVVKLNELGVDRSQSARWQLEASVPDDAFEDFIIRTRRAGKVLTAQSLLRLAKTHQTRQSAPDRNLRAGNATAWRKQSEAACGDALCRERQSRILDQATDLKEHVRLLSQVLAPMLNPEIAKSSEVNRRLIRRLLVEIESAVLDLIHSLATFEASCSASPLNPNRVEAATAGR